MEYDKNNVQNLLQNLDQMEQVYGKKAGQSPEKGGVIGGDSTNPLKEIE